MAKVRKRLTRRMKTAADPIVSEVVRYNPHMQRHELYAIHKSGRERLISYGDTAEELPGRAS